VVCQEACAVFVLCATTPISLSAQTFNTLFRFEGADGKRPQGALVQGTDENFYGPTAEGGGIKLGSARAGTAMTGLLHAANQVGDSHERFRACGTLATGC
jgi:hypothetical protein